MTLKYEMTGQRFGSLCVLGRGQGLTAKRERLWLCRCDCGQLTEARGNRLRTGRKRTCGCSGHTGVISHNQARTGRKKGHALYSLWALMRQRCNDPNHHNYVDYGGRGIKVCERWDSFERFVEDMGARPDGRSLDRRDNHGDYSPENCRWATALQQANNVRSNRLLEHDGRVLTVAQWARKAGLRYNTFWKRINRGETLPDALRAPEYSNFGGGQ